MVRTQIQLTEAQFAAIRARVKGEDRSLTDVIRGLVDELHAGGARPGIEGRRRRALASTGKLGAKGPRDLSRHHDAHLAEAYQRT